MVKTTDFTMSRRRQRASLPSLLLLTFSRLCCHLPRGGAAMFPPPSQQPLGANRNISKRRRSKSSLSHLVRSSPRGRRRRLKVEANVLREPDGFDIVGSPTLFDAKKDLKICSILGALDLTRLSSYLARSILNFAVEDVELLRESWTEGMANDGLRGGLSDLNDMASTLRWHERNEHAARQNFSDWTNLTADDTTESARLGYTDDRVGRRVDRYVSVTVGVPFVGTKETDMAMVDVTSNVLPWIVDRRANESMRVLAHHGGGLSDAEGEGKGKGVGSGTMTSFRKLYEDAWAATWGNALVYYPPLWTLIESSEPDNDAYADLVTIGDYVGGDFDLWTYFKRNAPPDWPFDHQVPVGGSIKDSVISLPNYEVGFNGNFIGLLSVMAPVYYTGQFRGFTYNDTFVGAVGIDVNTDEIAWVFDNLEDGLCDGSFALLVTASSFDVVAIRQSIVDKIYPERTGMEDVRIEYWTDASTGQRIPVDDRRNKTYEPRDTIFQGLLDGLESSNDWTKLHQAVLATPPGGRDHITMNLVLTGTTEPREYYAIFERWASVSNYVMLVFAPTESVDNAIQPILSASDVNLEIIHGGTENGTISLHNNGTLAFVADIAEGRSGGIPDWITLVEGDTWKRGVALLPGQSIDIEFVVRTTSLNLGIVTGPITLQIVDDGYRDCVHNTSIPIHVSVRVTNKPILRHLSPTVRIVGLIMCATVLVTATTFAAWVTWFRNVRVVRASQPLFLLMICCGCFVMGCTIIPLSIDDGVLSIRRCNMACMAVPWLFSMGFVLTFAALFSKIWRINKIFHQSNYRKVTVTEMDVIIPLTSIFTFNFIMLLCWTLLDPRVWTRVSLGEWESYGTCTANGKAHVAFYSIIGAVNITALGLACIQAYRARGIGDEFSESKYIGIALAGMLQVALLGIPLMFLITENTTANFFVSSTLVFVISMSVLLLTFVPKIVQMRNKKTEEAKKKADALTRVMQNASAGLILNNNNESLSQSTSKRTSLNETQSPGSLTHVDVRRGINDDSLKEDLEEARDKIELLKDQIAKLKDVLRQTGTDCDGSLREIGMSDDKVAFQGEE